jgi:hypothetical protein
MYLAHCSAATTLWLGSNAETTAAVHQQWKTEGYPHKTLLAATTPTVLVTSAASPAWTTKALAAYAAPQTTAVVSCQWMLQYSLEAYQ